MTHFQGKTVLVTGASSGIGRAVARQLVARGATVYGVASSDASASAARAADPAIHWLAADLRSPSAAEATVHAATAAGGQLHALINNAGVYKFAPLADTSDQLLREQFELNVFGAFALTRAALPALTAARGAIVNVSSTSAWKPMPNQSAYGATKAALESLTRSWAVELAPHGIRVNAVAPGPTLTEGISRLPFPPEVFAQMAAAIEAAIPLGRAAQPDEVAHWIVALADPSVTWLTGQVLHVDGGLSAT